MSSQAETAREANNPASRTAAAPSLCALFLLILLCAGSPPPEVRTNVRVPERLLVGLPRGLLVDLVVLVLVPGLGLLDGHHCVIPGLRAPDRVCRDRDDEVRVSPLVLPEDMGVIRVIRCRPLGFF